MGEELTWEALEALAKALLFGEPPNPPELLLLLGKDAPALFTLASEHPRRPEVRKADLLLGERLDLLAEALRLEVRDS